MNCQKCPHYADVRKWVVWNGDTAHPPTPPERREELSKLCTACQKRNGEKNGGNGDTFMHKGRYQVDIVAADFAAVDPDYEAAARPAPRQNRILDNAPEGVGQYLAALVAAFAAMDLADVELLHGLLNRMNETQIYRAFGYKSAAAVHSRMKKAFERNPWLMEIYTTGWTLPKTARRSRTWEKWQGKPMTRGHGMPPLAVGMPGVSPEETVTVRTQAPATGDGAEIEIGCDF